MDRFHIEYHLLNVDRRTISTYGEWQGGPLYLYKAQYRANTGMFKTERFFRAPDIDKARELAKAAIVQPKPKDPFWLILHKIALVEEKE